MKQFIFTSVLIVLLFDIRGQSISWELLAPMPEKVTNNAATSLTFDGETYLYSFSGIDSTLTCDGDHLRAFRYSLSTNTWETVPELPDPAGGKIGVAASAVKGKVYVVGGYHLAPNCSETSSNKIHIFDPQTNTYLADGANIPVAIDDQVQAVWRDSLIYVVTGWSNNINVTNVQVYNPSTDVWQQATPVGSGSSWRVFGGSGMIIGDTIYYAGGARSTAGFVATTHFRKGYINPDNPYEISWEQYTEPLALGYRMGAATFNGQAIWIGGADDTYNFDALAYNGSGIINPLDRIGIYDSATGQWSEIFGFIPSIMDIRGVAELGNGEYLIAGGILANQEVTNQLLKITINDLTNAPALWEEELGLTVFPNPTGKLINVRFASLPTGTYTWQLIAADGKHLKSGQGTPSPVFSITIDDIPVGNYWLQFHFADGSGHAIPIQRM